MDPDEIARRQLEQDLEQIGTEADMVDSRCMSSWNGTFASYEDAAGNVHYFNLAPIGSDAVLPPEFPL
jgi:hypothetical protein